MANRVRVAVRLRPLNDREVNKGACECIEVEGDRCTIHDAATKQQHQFTFNKCYSPTGNLAEEQRTIFEDLGRDLVSQAVQGYNVTVLAYGQTGSGKSLSMVGHSSGENDTRGIIPRIAEELFEFFEGPAATNGTTTAKVTLKLMEIYNEQVKDLLAQSVGEKQTPLRVREDPSTGPYVEGLCKHTVATYAEVAKLMEVGLQARSIAATNMNSGSSRAHTICQLEYQRISQEAASSSTVSLINLVDLAGSERSSEAGTNENASRMKESVNINKSLTALGQCIRSLSDGANKAGKHVSYRDSTLTWLLKSSLGGNAKTVMIATISPGSSEYNETLSTLRYADRMQRVQTAAVVNKKVLVPESTSDHYEQSCSPRGILGVDYTIGEDVSDESNSSEDELGDLPGRQRRWPRVPASGSRQPAKPPPPRISGAMPPKNGRRVGGMPSRQEDGALMTATLKKPLKHYMR